MASDGYTAAVPSESFSSIGTTIVAASATGGAFGVLDTGLIYVPDGYVLGTALVGSLTFTGQAIASLGINENFSLSWNGGAETLTVVAVPAPPTPKHHKLFILTGQSNSLGTTNGGETDPSSGSDPSDQNVIFSWHNVVSSGTSIGHSGETLNPVVTTADFTTLQDQQGGVYGDSATHWGPEVEFARTLYRAGVRDFGVIKVSRGGGGNSLWIKGSGHMYSQITTTVAEAVASLPAMDTYEIVGLLYLQGESNNSAEAAAAGTRFKALVDDLRTDLTNASSLHGVIAGITAQGNAADNTTRANHAAIATSTAYIDYFDNLDLQDRLSPDNLHLNKAGKIVVGNRFAQTFLNSGIVDRHYGKVVFIGDSIIQGGGNSNPSYRYQVFKHLATAGVPINATAGYKFVGSLSTAVGNSAIIAPNVNGQSFENNHDGHWGWRAMWVNGRVALPANRRDNYRGEGTILNWTGQAVPQQYVTSSGTVPFPDPSASNTGSFASDWSASAGITATPVGADDLQLAHTSGTANVLDGTNTDWANLNDGVWTFTTRIKFNANAKGFILWFGTGTHRILIEIHGDRTQDYGGESFNVAHDNLDGLFHTFKVKHDPANSVYHLWRDGVLLTPVAGAGYDATASDQRLLMGDYNGATTFGDGFDVTIDYIEYCGGYQGNNICSDTSNINGWATVGGVSQTQVNTTDLQITNTSNGGNWLEGTNAGWSDKNDGYWTFEIRLKFDALPNGFSLWLGTGSELLLIELHADHTQDSGAESFNVSHNNADGNYHTFRVGHDPSAKVYHIWRDGVRLSPLAGAAYDSTSNEERLILGDTTGAAYGNGFDATIDYIRGDTGNAYLPVGTDADSDGMSDLWEHTHFGHMTSTQPGDDEDNDGLSNLKEYTADTDANDNNSLFQIESIEKTSTPDEYAITVPKSSTARHYTLQESDDLGITDAWEAVIGQGPTAGTGGNLVFNATSTTTRFYRVVVSIP